MRIAKLYIFLFLNCFLINVDGQNVYNSSDNLKFKHFGTREGLSQSSVISILQDNHSYLWFGTRDGLNRYDGTKFVKYWHDSEDIKSLTHSWVTSLFEDSSGNLWIGTKGGLNKYIELYT